MGCSLVITFGRTTYVFDLVTCWCVGLVVGFDFSVLFANLGFQCFRCFRVLVVFRVLGLVFDCRFCLVVLGLIV